MLTLNMTRGDDKNVIFLLKIDAEGNNLAAYSDFASATGWTTTGDWAIGSGVATYTYVDDASGDLERTLEAATGVEYVLEYTVISKIGTGFNLYLRGASSGTLFSSLQYDLDLTIGKHVLTFLGDSGGGTTLRLGADNFGASDVLVIDDVKVRKKQDSITISTRDITLDSTVYDGKVLSWNEVGDLSQYLAAEPGGGIGAVTGIDFAISRHTVNTRTSDFFNEFYPAYNGGNIIARPVQFGMVWNTATTEAEITWLFKGRVLDMIPEQRNIRLIILQESEFDNTEIPYYSIQKDFDNVVSYFNNIIDEDIGIPLPIIYGDFSGGTSTAYREREMKLAPTILINPAKDQVLACSHKCDAVSYNNLISNESVFYKEVGGAYQAIYNIGNTTYVNNDLRHTISMQELPEGDVKGVIYLPLEQLSDYSQVQEISNLLDNDITNYISLDGGEKLAMRVGTSFSSSEFGSLGVLPEDVQIVFWVSTDGGGDREITFGYYNKTLNTTPNSHTDTVTLTLGTKTSEDLSFGNSVTAKRDAIIPWTIEELCNLEFFIENKESAGSYVRVYEIYLYCGNIIVSGYSTKYKAVTRRGHSDDPLYGYQAINPPQRYYVAGQGFTGSWYGVNKSGNVKATNSSLFVYVKGREFGRWVDNVLASSRDNGYDEGDLIENPAYIIESIFRDEKFTERDLVITSSADTTHFVCNNTKNKASDYYNYAEFFNATRIAEGETKSYVTDYDGATNIFTVNDAITSMAAGDDIYLTNIQGDYRIDYTTFDTIGNTSDGLRDGWKFARSINTKQSFQSLIDEILFESHCALFESADEDNGYSKIKVKALDSGSGDTWSRPAYANGLPQVKLSFTELGQLYTSYKLFYHYDVGKGDYPKSISVDRNGYSNPSGGTTLTDEHKNLCAYAENTFNLINPFSYSSNWIYDDATAEYFLDKKIRWFSKRRLKVNWTTPLCDNLNDVDYLKYELGDQVKLDYSDMIPTGINNSSYFMIMGKTIITNPQGSPYIIFELIEL